MKKRKKILLVDDESGMRMIMKRILKEIGNFDFYEADNGVAAINEIRRVKPDLVFLDLLMPLLDGVKTLKRIKEDDEIKDVRVIIVTSESSLKVVKEVITYGAVDYVVKPFDVKTLQEKARNWL